MLRHIEARKLHRVAHALVQMADLMWRPEIYDVDPDKRVFKLYLDNGPRPSESQPPLVATLRDGLSPIRE
jgi:hypothetical protein